jgi:hypothetical protein
MEALDTSELLSAGLVEELCAAASRHGVMITLSVMPPEEEPDEE